MGIWEYGLLFNLWSDDLARTTPCREAVQHHHALLAERLVELLLRREVLYALAHCRGEVSARVLVEENWLVYV